MPILGQEQPVLFSMDEVFNPTTANMLLLAQLNYGNILRLDYQLSLLDFKDFNKNFGDFYSVIAADNLKYYDETLGGLGNLYDAMMNQGVDPLRSQEGRSMLLRYIATRPYGELANIRRSADAAKEYIKNRDDLIALGLYNPEFDEFTNADIDPTLWDTTQRGIWNRTSPEQYKDLNTSTKHWFDNIELSYDEAASKATGGVYDVYTKSEGTMRAIMDTRLKDYLSTNIGKFHLSKYNGDVEALKNAIVDANREVIQQKRSMNEEYAMNRKFAHDIEMENLLHKHALDRQRKAGVGKTNTDLNLFEAAQQNRRDKGLAIRYNEMESVNNGLYAEDPKWNTEVGKIDGEPYSEFRYMSDDTPVLYKWEDVIQKDGSVRRMFKPVKIKHGFKEDGSKKDIVLTNGGVLNYINYTYNKGYYNKVFLDTDKGTLVYWLKMNDGSKIKPGKTKTPYNSNKK